MTVYVYKFSDGTKLELLNTGLSVMEMWKLTDLHGNCTVSTYNL